MHNYNPTYELSMVEYQSKPEFKFFHKFTNLERIFENPTILKNTFFQRKWNAIKLMDFYTPMFFWRLRILKRKRTNIKFFK
jgi:hypothetical protein